MDTGEYKGPDAVADTLVTVTEEKDSLRHHLLSKHEQVTFEDLTEDAIVELAVNTLYESHHREAHVLPASDQSDVSLHRAEYSSDNVSPTVPDLERGGTETVRYPRENTARTVMCTFCNSGKLTCPNCKGESAVTCPSCNTHRGGDCSKCRGSGQLTCGKCSGDGNCRKCTGSGRVDCPGCSGGTVKETTRFEKECPDCLGHDDDCTTCDSNGMVTERVTENVKHDRCHGRGWIECSNCNASGGCPNCNATGKVTCGRCSGSGICQKCSGGGTLQCPTCSGARSVTCPICRGENKVFLYTSDVYRFDSKIDPDVTVPEGFEDHYSDREGHLREGRIHLPDLDDDTVSEQLGLINPDVRSTLSDARDDLDALYRKGEDREYEKDRTLDDESLQDESFDRIAQDIVDQWNSTNSDSYNASFRTSVESRTDADETNYRRILSREALRALLPGSMLTASVGEETQSLVTSGTQEESVSDPPEFGISYPKVGLLTAACLSLGGAAWSLASGATGGYGTISLPDLLQVGTVTTVPNVSVMALTVFLFATVLYSYLVSRSVTDSGTDTLLVVADSNDVLTEFFSGFVDEVETEDDSTVLGLVPGALASADPADLTVGSSISLRVDLNTVGELRIVGTTAPEDASDTERLAALSGIASGAVDVVDAENGRPTLAGIDDSAALDEVSTAYIWGSETKPDLPDDTESTDAERSVRARLADAPTLATPTQPVRELAER